MSELQSLSAFPPAGQRSCIVAAPPGPFDTSNGSFWYHNYGMLVRDFQAGMPKYPVRPPYPPYQAPLFYNSGCDGETCPTQNACPRGTSSAVAPQTQAMLDRLFAARPEY